MFNKFTTAGISHPAQGSAEFDGASYIQLDTPFSYTNHTIAAWVYVEDDAANKMIFDTRDGGSDGIVIFSGTTENIVYLLNAINANTSTTTYANQWIFVTATYDGTTQKLYIDGSLIDSNTTSQTINTTTDARIGAQSYSLASYFKGNLANVAIWNRALSSDEINSVMWKSYTLLNTSEKEGLQAWYSLEESELLSGDSTPTLEKYAAANSLTFEGKQCLQDALNALPTITDARLYSAKYDIRVSADGGTVESLDCVETELNAIV